MVAPFVAVKCRGEDLHWSCLTEEEKTVTMGRFYTDSAAPTTPCPRCKKPLNKY